MEGEAKDGIGAKSAPQTHWTEVCGERDLVTDSGICALVKGEQVAIFREGRGGGVYALSNYDPIGDANVLSRGILGSLGGRLVVASPLYKQHFCLHSGECLEDASARVRTWPVKIEGGRVYIEA